MEAKKAGVKPNKPTNVQSTWLMRMTLDSTIILSIFIILLVFTTML